MTRGVELSDAHGPLCYQAPSKRGPLYRIKKEILCFSLTDGPKMEGNDFILFKHGCGNDSTYPIDHNPTITDEYKITDEEKQRFQKPCKNKIFYHVEVEFLGNQSYIYNYEHPNDETETGHPEKDSNPVIFKIRNATLLDLGLTESGKEEIWFDRAQEITLKSDRIKKEYQMRSVLYKQDFFRLHSIIYFLFKNMCYQDEKS